MTDATKCQKCGGPMCQRDKWGASCGNTCHVGGCLVVDAGLFGGQVHGHAAPPAAEPQLRGGNDPQVRYTTPFDDADDMTGTEPQATFDDRGICLICRVHKNLAHDEPVCEECVERKLNGSRIPAEPQTTGIGEIKAAVATLSRGRVCTHDTFEPLGFGDHWGKCEDCGEQFDIGEEATARRAIAAAEFEDAVDVIMDRWAEREADHARIVAARDTEIAQLRDHIDRLQGVLPSHADGVIDMQRDEIDTLLAACKEKDATIARLTDDLATSRHMHATLQPLAEVGRLFMTWYEACPWPRNISGSRWVETLNAADAYIASTTKETQ